MFSLILPEKAQAICGTQTTDPLQFTIPLVFETSQAIAERRVDLPRPTGPVMAVRLTGAAVTSTSCRKNSLLA